MAKNRKLYTRLLISFLVTSLAPIVLVVLFAYFNSATIIEDNYSELTAVNLEQTRRSLAISLDSYEDILYQLYTDDQIIGLTESMNKDMWLTGFDVPSLATMYVYKPMSGHNLMQAIARVNRVFRDKEGGLVVDYVGIARALKEAMKDYTVRDRKNYSDLDIANTALPKSA